MTDQLRIRGRQEGAWFLLVLVRVSVLGGVLLCSAAGCSRPPQADTPQATIERFFERMRAGEWDAAAELATAPFDEYLRSVGAVETARQQLLAAGRQRFGPSADEALADIATTPELPANGPPITDVTIDNDRATLSLDGISDTKVATGRVELVHQDGRWRVVGPDSEEYTRLQVAENQQRVAVLMEGAREIEAGIYASAAHASKWIRGRPVGVTVDRMPLVLLDGRAIYRAHVDRVHFLLQLVQVMGGPAIPDNGLVWFLLEEECDRGGIAVAEDALEQTRAALRESPTVEGVQRAAESLHMSVTQFEREALEGAALVSRVALLVERRAEELAKDAELEDPLKPRPRATVRITDVRAEPLLEKVPAPSPAEIKAHYERYADSPTPLDSGPDHYGYQRPTRYILEYVVADPNDFAAAQDVTEPEAYAYYEQYREHFSRTNSDAQTEASKSTFDAVREQVLAAARQRRAWEKACARISDFRARYVGRIAAAENESAPEAHPSLAAVLADDPRGSDLRVAETGAITLPEIDSRLGRVWTLDRFRTPLPTVVAALAEDRPAPSESERIARMLGAEIPLAERLDPPVVLGREPAPAAAEPAASVLLIRLIRGLPPETPALADVRAPIESDLRLRAAMAAASELAERLVAVAREDQDLTAAVTHLQQADPERAPAITSVRETAVLRGGFPPRVADAVFALAGPGESGAGHTICVADWDRKCYSIVELLGVEEAGESEGAEHARILTLQRMAFFDLTSPEKMVGRLNLAIPPEP